MVIRLNEDKNLEAQRKEITEHLIYRGMSRRVKDKHNREILERIAGNELEDYNLWKTYTGEEVKPDHLKVLRYGIISRILGITFTIKLLEKSSIHIQEAWQMLSRSIPDGKTILQSRIDREKELVGLIDEERLKYLGSTVLGLNDALVELTGILAGFSFALQNARIIAVAGLITGVAATLSMGASVYLASQSENGALSPLKSAFYPSIAYLLTVFFLVYPYLVFENPFFGLALTVFNAVVVILAFTYYCAVTQDLPFGSRFRRMLFISLGVAALTFIIGFAVRKAFNINI